MTMFIHGMACGDDKVTYSLYMISKCKLLVTRSKNQIETRVQFFSHIGNRINCNFKPCNRRVRLKLTLGKTQLFSVSSPACIPIITNSNLIFRERLEMFHIAVQLSAFHFTDNQFDTSVPGAFPWKHSDIIHCVFYSFQQSLYIYIIFTCITFCHFTINLL